MKEYLLSVLAAALAISLIGILAPNGSQSALKLLSALFFLCMIAAPLPQWLSALPKRIEEITTPPQNTAEQDYQQQATDALNAASKAYLAQILTQFLEEKFSIPTGEVRCAIRWAEGEEALPERVTVILSGSAIWKNPKDIEAAVTNLLGCECVTAIE